MGFVTLTSAHVLQVVQCPVCYITCILNPAGTQISASRRSKKSGWPGCSCAKLQERLKLGQYVIRDILKYFWDSYHICFSFLFKSIAPHENIKKKYCLCIEISFLWIGQKYICHFEAQNSIIGHYFVLFLPAWKAHLMTEISTSCQLQWFVRTQCQIKAVYVSLADRIHQQIAKKH